MKILLLGAELLHAAGGTVGRTDMTKLIVAFLSFTNTAIILFTNPKYFAHFNIYSYTWNSADCETLR